MTTIYKPQLPIPSDCRQFKEMDKIKIFVNGAFIGEVVSFTAKSIEYKDNDVVEVDDIIYVDGKTEFSMIWEKKEK